MERYKNLRQKGAQKGNFLFALAILSCSLTSVLCPLSYAQSHIPVQEKIQYEAALEAKVVEVLADILGANHARVSVEAIVGKPKEPAAAEAVPEGRFKWSGISQEPAADAQQLLPGFYAAAREHTGVKAPDSAVFLPFLIKRISVNIVLDRKISPAQATDIDEVVTGLLNLDLKRGDTINIVRAPFMSVWKTMLTNPDFATMLARYGLISVIVLFSMMVLAAAVFKLAGSMGSMAQAQQAHQIEMSFVGKGGGGDALALENPAGGEQPAREAADAAAPAGDGEVIFNVQVKHVPLLKFVFEKEDPANIAIIVAHLPPDTRRALLGAFDRELSSKIMLNMAKVRFVEPEIVSEIKEELERKINSAMGGVPKVIEFMGELGFKAKKDLIKIFEAQEPALARDIRAMVLLDDDLARLAEKDLSILISALTLGEWSDIIPALSDDFRARIKAVLPERSWAIIEQMQVSAPSAAKMDAGLEKMVAAAEKLIKEGRIARPPALSNLLAPATGQKSEAGGQRSEDRG